MQQKHAGDQQQTNACCNVVLTVNDEGLPDAETQHHTQYTYCTSVLQTHTLC